MKQHKRERIVAAAISYDGLIFSLPKPARHAHILWQAGHVLGKDQVAYATQGFTTSTGRFVNRIEAKNIAWLAGQKSIRDDEHPTDLFSEDLW